MCAQHAHELGASQDHSAQYQSTNVQSHELPGPTPIFFDTPAKLRSTVMDRLQQPDTAPGPGELPATAASPGTSGRGEGGCYWEQEFFGGHIGIVVSEVSLLLADQY